MFTSNTFADDVAIAGERSLPQAVAQDDDRVLPGRDLIRRQQRPAELGTHAEPLEVVARHQLADDRLGAGCRIPG